MSPCLPGSSVNGYNASEKRFPECREPSMLHHTILLLMVAVTAQAADSWPAWRGPENNGVAAAAAKPPVTLDDTTLAWRTPLPGAAGSTPVVWGERVFLTSADGDDLVLLCIDAAGKELWSRTLGEGNRTARGDEGNSASSSPVTDGQRVWAMVGTGDLACYDFSGEPVWRMDLEEQYGKFQIQFGMSSSPVLHDGRLYLQLLHSGGAHVIALDSATGEEVWHVTRRSDATAECEHSYASPVIAGSGDDAYLITHGCDYVIAYGLTDGKELWRRGGFNPKGDYNPTLRFVASPAVADGMVVVPSAKNGPVRAVSIDAEGGVGAEEGNLWVRERGTPDVPSPLIAGGVVYLCRENGVLVALDAATGQELYEERVHSQRHRASPVLADGRIYLTARDGTVSVVKAGRTFELLAKNPLGEEIAASPAVVGHRIYIRTFESLMAFDNRAAGVAAATYDTDGR